MHPLLHFNCRQLEVQDLFAGQEQQVLSAVVSQPKTVLLTRTFSHEIDKWTLGTRFYACSYFRRTHYLRLTYNAAYA